MFIKQTLMSERRYLLRNTNDMLTTLKKIIKKGIYKGQNKGNFNAGRKPYI